MDEKLFKETFSRLRASEGSKKELIEMTNENKLDEKRRRIPRTAKKALVCAAVIGTLLALTATALAATEYLGGWVFDRESNNPFTNTTYTELKRGEIEHAMVPNSDYGAEAIDAEEPTVVLPISKGAKVIVDENGRVLVSVYLFRGMENTVDWVYDITDELAESPDGTYNIFGIGQAEDGTNWKVDITVLPVTEDMEVREGNYGYVMEGDIFCWWYVDGCDSPFTSGLHLDGWEWNTDAWSYRSDDPHLAPEEWVRHAKVIGNMPE